MNLAHRTLCHSPAPEFACRCRLPFSKADCIVTASGTKLQIFSWKDETLKIVWEKNFWGDIFGVFRHCSGDEYDSVIVGIDISKIIILQVVDNDLKEVEFHYFHKQPGRDIDVDIDIDEPTRLRNKTLMACDPTGTCLAMLIAQKSLYLLPLSNKNKIENKNTPPDEDHSAWNVIKYAVRYDVHQDFNEPFYRIRDIIFLDGYKSPTIALMHELCPTWSVRLPVQHSTVCVSIVSPPLLNKTNDKVTVWTSRPLPHNSYGIFPVPIPIGGFLVLSKNALIYMTQTNGSALALNNLAYLDDEVPIDITSDSPECCECYSKVACALDPSHILLTVDQHYFAVLTLHYNRVLVTGTSLHIQRDIEFHPSVFITLERNLVFLGSHIHDSVLAEITLEEEKEYLTEFLNDYQMSESQISIYQNFYKELPHPKSDILVSKINYKPRSYIRQLGTVVTATPCIAFNREDNEEPIAMAMGCGFKESGCIQLLRTAIPPHVIEEVQIDGVTGLFTSENFPIIIATSASETRAFKLINAGQGENSIIPDETNLQDTLITNEHTILADDFINDFVQITSSSVRVIKYSPVDDEYNYEDIYSQTGLEIRLACISNNAIVVLFSSGLITTFDRSFHQRELTNDKFVYRMALHGKNLFVLTTNNILRVYSLESLYEIAVFEQFKLFPEVVNAKKPDDQPVPAPSSTHTIIDMKFIVLEAVVILCLIPVSGRIIIYQWVEQKMFFRRIHHRRWGNINKRGEIIPFQDISKYTGGAVVNVPNPFFILSENGYPRIVPMSSDKFKPKTFAPLRAGSFTSHFIMADDNLLRLCDLSTSISDNNFYIIDGCLVQRIPIGQTVRSIAYAQNLNAIAFSQSTPLPFTHENEKEIDVEVFGHLPTHYQQPPSPEKKYPEEDLDGIPKNTEEHYSVCILMEHGITYTIDYANHEIVNTVAFVHTTDKPEDGISKLYVYLAVGTGFMSVDEKMMRGVLYLYKAMITSTEDDKNEITLRCLYNEKNKIFKNPILTITENSGYIALFLGNLMYLMRFYNESAVKIEAFLVGRFFTSSLVSLKNYLLYADSYEGFEVVRWRKYGKKLISMAKDTLTRIPLSAAFTQQDDILGGIVFDNDQNCHIFDIDEYAIPQDAVVRQSMFHIPGRALNSGHFPIKQQAKEQEQKEGEDQQTEEMDEDIIGAQKITGHITWYVTTNGTVGAFTPIEESDRHRLCVVQSSYEKFANGLSHFDYRSAKFKSRKEHDLFIQGPQLVVDMDFLLDLLDAQTEVLAVCFKNSYSSKADCFAALQKIYYNGLDVFQ